LECGGLTPLFYSVAPSFEREQVETKAASSRRTPNMSDTITVYEKPTCTKCREMDRFLRESGVDFSKINYYLEPLSEKKLRELIRKMNLSPRDLLRTSEPIYRELGLSKKDLSDDEIISLMVKHPDLMQRPIVERGDRAVLGRPTENVKPLLK
jgi:arsenate reductase